MYRLALVNTIGQAFSEFYPVDDGMSQRRCQLRQAFDARELWSLSVPAYTRTLWSRMENPEIFFGYWEYPLGAMGIWITGSATTH